MVVPGRGRVQRIPGPVSLEAADSNGTDREREEENCAQTGEGSRESLLLDME